MGRSIAMDTRTHPVRRGSSEWAAANAAVDQVLALCGYEAQNVATVSITPTGPGEITITVEHRADR
jgi:hypothetical protein